MPGRTASSGFFGRNRNCIPKLDMTGISLGSPRIIEARRDRNRYGIPWGHRGDGARRPSRSSAPWRRSRMSAPRGRLKRCAGGSYCPAEWEPIGSSIASFAKSRHRRASWLELRGAGKVGKPTRRSPPGDRLLECMGMSVGIIFGIRDTRCRSSRAHQTTLRSGAEFPAYARDMIMFLSSRSPGCKAGLDPLWHRRSSRRCRGKCPTFSRGISPIVTPELESSVFNLVPKTVS